MVALWAIALQNAPGQAGAQVMQQGRGLTDGIDPGLGARRLGHMGAVAAGKDQGVRRLQGRADSDEPVVQVQPGVRQPWWRARTRRGQREV